MMKKGNAIKRLLCMMLVVAMLAGFAVPASAAGTVKVTIEQVDNSEVSASLPGREPAELPEEESPYADTDVVRVSIVLEKAGTIQAGYSPLNITENAAAMSYRGKLQTEQDTLVTKIEKATSAELDVVWNLTLAANIISANVEYGQIEQIEKVPGVKRVLIETVYEPDVVSKADADPNMGTSGKQTGTSAVWASGYTGAGSRIAIIDTGTDTDHQSFDAGAFEYSLSLQAAEAGMTLEAYMEELDLLDVDEITEVAGDLNVRISPASAYVNSKLPFGFNYVDTSYYISHELDYQSEHGSHVAGIAAANAYIPQGSGIYAPAMDSVMVQGVAPDAQIITMKVYGINGGGRDSDYMAAIEDAIVLGCDAINLSLGSGNPGMSRNSVAEYQAIMDNLVNSGVVVSISAGNSGYWTEYAYNAGYLYTDDVSMQTNGSPGSYTNALTVASVDNDGTTGYYVSVGDKDLVYAESTGYGNHAFISIAGEYDFVLIDGYGTAADWAAVGDALDGAIAICSRGETSFYEKANGAVAAGAAATLVYNNAAGIFYMDLTGYNYTNPVAGLTPEQAETIRAAGTAVTDADGNVLYYTGKMTVHNTIGAGQYNSEYYTMSSFSSWGTPGSLELKPEITAPGGNINSVFGETPEGGGSDQYELMSGTSMAAPQITGMAAVFAQYARETGLEAQTKQDVRTLANSLLMSTAVPMIDGSTESYYPVIQQGAGLANIGLAVAADSYILMNADATASYADGKVKAELGDDPDRDGKYSFSFNINNLTDEEQYYDLRADFFIQDTFEYFATANESLDETAYYMDTWTKPIDVTTVFKVNGKGLGEADLSLDFNGDGQVDDTDGEAILDYATGLVTSLTNQVNADMDGDGDIDSYDAYAFFTRSDSAVKVPANGSATVTVEITLSAEAKADIEANFENGTYIEGYVFAEGVASAEGEAGTAHSIPVLAYYGNWSDPSMFDVGTSMEYYHGDEYRLPYLGNEDANTFVVAYAGDTDDLYHFGGNPFVPDDTYMPERNAINSENGDIIDSVYFTVIRNAAASKFTAVNKTTGELLEEYLTGEAPSAYYYVNGGAWYNTSYSLDVEFDPAGASENDVLEVAMTLAPEYYVDAEGNVDWDALGEGATFSMPMVVDNTAPKIADVDVDVENNTITVTASDNQYVAAVALYNKSGTKVHTYAGAQQDIGTGETAEFVLDLTGVYGKNFMIQVMDYAMNTATYAITAEIGEEPILPGLIAYDLDMGYWTTFDHDTVGGFDGLPMYTDASDYYFSATIADKYVFAVTDVGVLHVMPQYDLSDVTVVADLGISVYDMAYNQADGKVYGLTDGDLLITIDKLTGAVEVIGEIGITTNTLACDKNGNFYCNNYTTGDVYTFTLDTLANPQWVCDVEEVDSGYIQAMEYDPNTDLLCWTSYYISATDGYGYSYYVEIDPADGTYTVYNDLWDELAALLIPDKSATEGAWAEPTDEVLDIQISQSSMTLLRGGSAYLGALVLPWTANDRSVTWSSADESIATVNANGKVTGVGMGTTTITATSNLDPSLTATCQVTVESLKITLKGTLMDVDGNPMFYEWDMENSDTWTGGVMLDTTITSTTVDTINNIAYVMDSESYSMHKVDPTTGVTMQTASNQIAPMWDMEYSTFFSTASDPLLTTIYGPYVMPGQNPMALDGYYFDLSNMLASYTGADYFVAVASAGKEAVYDDEYYTWVDTEHVLMLDNAGGVWDFWIYAVDGGYTGWLGLAGSDLYIDYPGYGDVLETSMVVGDDGNLYVSAFDGSTNVLYRLVYDEASEAYYADRIGDFGADVWPATLTSVTTNASAQAASADAAKAIAKVTAQEANAETFAAFAAEFEANRVEPFTMAQADRSGKPAAEVETAAVAETEIKPLARPVKSAAPLSDNTVTDNENTITVTVTAKNVTGTDVNSNNGKMTVDYDAEALTLVSTVVNADYSSVNDKTDGSVVFAYVDLAGVAAGETVATLVFTRNEGTVGEGSLTITDDEVDDTNPGYVEDLPINYEHPNTEVRNAKEATCTEHGYTGDTYCADCGKLLAEGEETPLARHNYEDGFCIECGAEQPPYTLGDANDDGVIDNVDAMLIMQYTVGMEVSGLNLAACDVNGDGVIDNVDAMLVMQYYVGIITAFPAKQ